MLFVTSCTTRENSCSEGEHVPCDYACCGSDESLCSEGSAMSGLPSSAPGGTHWIGSEKSLEYPFSSDDDDDYQIEAALVAMTPEEPVLPGPFENHRGCGRNDSEDVGDDDSENETAFTAWAHWPSMMSQLHASGQCRPCAWYWKPGGCINGESCRHCHECLEGEILDRKRNKVKEMKEMRRHGVRRAATENASHQAIARIARRPAPAPRALPGDFTAPREMVATRSLPLPPGLQVLAALMTPPPGLELQPMTVGRAAPATPQADPAVCLPSEGSSLHASGACKPCAWYWKPGGCQNTRECRHCHLCPPGEIAARKRRATGARQLGPGRWGPPPA